LSEQTPPQVAPATILIVDDDQDFTRIVCRYLEGRGYLVRTAASGEEAFRSLDAHVPDIMLLDYRLPDTDGLQILSKARAVYPDLDVVMITSYASIPMAVEAMKHGAAEYITKPFLPDEVARTLENIIEKRNLIRQNRRLLSLLNDRWGLDALKGQSRQMRRVREEVRMLGPAGSTVLITGESGTGKELVARALHVLSTRAAGPFIAVNAAGLPASLAESELFGYKKGAFTGAERDKDGLFLAAHGGTLFLDEIAEMPLDLQPRLLRAIETLEIRPVGGEESRKVDIRILAATNRDLDAEVAAGRFRRDLFYRLNVVQITLPPLRARRGDIPELAEHFLAMKRGDKPIRGFSTEAMNLFLNYSWPGNVRELEHAVERAAALALGAVIEPDDLPRQIVASSAAQPRGADGASTPPLLPLSEIERIAVLRTMAATGGDKSRAARILGINRATLYRKLREAGHPSIRPHPAKPRRKRR
jgi:DNA-binding NtrC family response regulator